MLPLCTMSEAAESVPRVEIQVRLNKRALYWYFVRAFTSFPSAGMAFPVLVVAYFDFQAGNGFYNTIAVALFLYVLLPWVFILVGYRSTYLKNPVRHVLSPSGISTAIPPVHNYVEWSWAKMATENHRYILIMLKNGFVMLPKNQLTTDEINSVRAIVKEKLKGKARLRAE